MIKQKNNFLLLSFFNSEPLLSTKFGGANSVLRGLCKDAAQIVDPTFVDDLRNFLSAPTGKDFSYIKLGTHINTDHIPLDFIKTC